MGTLTSQSDMLRESAAPEKFDSEVKNMFLDVGEASILQQSSCLPTNLADTLPPLHGCSRGVEGPLRSVERRRRDGARGIGVPRLVAFLCNATSAHAMHPIGGAF